MRFKWFAAVPVIALIVGLHPARADEKVDALMKKVSAAYSAAKTLSADLIIQRKRGTTEKKITGFARLMKPNRAWIQYMAPTSQIIASDGKFLWTYLTSMGLYTKQPMDPRGRNLGRLPILQMFFDPVTSSIPETIFGSTGKCLSRILPSLVEGGKLYRVVEYSQYKPTHASVRIRIGADNLIYHVEIVKGSADKQRITTMTVINLRIGKPMNPSIFIFAPPKTA